MLEQQQIYTVVYFFVKRISILLISISNETNLNYTNSSDSAI